MKQLEETTLKAEEKVLHQLRFIEMEGVLTVMPFEEIPVE